MTRFRAKRIDNGKWVHGYYVRYGRKCYIYTGEVNEDDSPRFFEVSGDTVGEWTGFIDCTGNLVFDGDIFLTIDNHYSVATSCKLNKSMDAEIVGNKWDNSDLLEDGKRKVIADDLIPDEPIPDSAWTDKIPDGVMHGSFGSFKNPVSK